MCSDCGTNLCSENFYLAKVDDFPSELTGRVGYYLVADIVVITVSAEVYIIKETFVELLLICQSQVVLRGKFRFDVGYISCLCVIEFVERWHAEDALVETGYAQITI